MEEDVRKQQLTSALLDHNYALNMKVKKEDEFKCSTCGKVFLIKSRLSRHQQENCNVEPKKSESCPICGKSYTYNGLRDHFRNFTEPNRAFRGKHKFFSTDHHLNLLKKLCL